MFQAPITIHNSKPSDQTGKQPHFELYPQLINMLLDVGMCAQRREIVTAIRLSCGGQLRRAHDAERHPLAPLARPTSELTHADW